MEIPRWRLRQRQRLENEVFASIQAFPRPCAAIEPRTFNYTFTLKELGFAKASDSEGQHFVKLRLQMFVYSYLPTRFPCWRQARVVTQQDTEAVAQALAGFVRDKS